MDGTSAAYSRDRSWQLCCAFAPRLLKHLRHIGLGIGTSETFEIQGLIACRYSRFRDISRKRMQSSSIVFSTGRESEAKLEITKG